MRHKKSFNHLGRKSAHRRAMLSNMAASLIMHKRIETTTAKAKALKRYIEPLITRSKDDSTHSRRVVFSYLQDKEAVSELFRDVGAKVADRPGGYTRIIKLGNRQGDNADMCLIELVDYNETLLAEKAASRKSASRRRRGGSKKKVEEGAAATGAVATETTEETAEVEETPKAEVEAPVEEPAAEVEETPKAEVEAPVEEPAAEEEEAPKAEDDADEAEDKAEDEEKKD
jgi:large subunit ribosomal protein L17